MNEEELYIENPKFIGTSGGQAWLDEDWYLDSFSLDFEKVSLTDIPGEEFKKMAIDMINHLVNCGHDFKILPTDRNNHSYLADDTIEYLNLGGDW